MEKEKLEKTLNDVGIKTIWVYDKNAVNKIEEFIKGKNYFISPYLKINLEGSTKIEDAEIGIFEAIALCKKTGTILISSDDLASLIPPISLAILKERNILNDIDDLIDIIKRNPEKSFSFITGPSRTADIEKQLVIPAHGPKEIFLLILKNI